MSPALQRVVFAVAFGGICVIAGAYCGSANAAAAVAGIASIVNDFVITNYDLEQHIALFKVTSGVAVTAEALPQIRADILTTLEDQVLEQQETAKRKVTVSNADIDMELQNVAAERHLSVEQMSAMITAAGTSVDLWRMDITTRLTWRELINERFNMLTSESDVKEAMENYLRDLRRDAIITRP